MSGKKDKIKDKDRFSVLVPVLDRCSICGSTDRVAIHEVFFGAANRKKSKEDGMIVPLCYNHHLGNQGVHTVKKLDLKIKQNAEKVWIEKYTDKNISYNDRIQLFIDRYGKNYLD